MRLLRLFMRCRTGATAVEYGLIMALIAVVIITGASAAGTAIGGKFTYVSQQWFLATSGSGS
jgi:pilus assembly protein Flp/PilA